MKTVEIKITGMSCNHCVKSVQDELIKLPLEKFEVTVGNAKVEYDESKITIDKIENAIIEASFEVSG